MNSNIRPAFRPGLLMSASVAAMALANPAYAQSTTPEDAAAVAAPESADPCIANPNAEGCATVTVTGSRIRQPEFTSPDPVARINPETAKREGKFDTADMLQSSPIAAGSTQITSAISSNFVTNGGPGAQTIDLRGLGANRTLVLLNGRRAGPAGVRGGVSSFDLNVLPQSIVKSVDILKTGASSVYGSDAVAGVVNLITKTDTDGIELDGFASIPTRYGGDQLSISATWGKKFDRGHILIAADYFEQKELQRGDRKYLGCPEANIFRKDGSRADLTDPRTGKYHCEDLRWGHVWTYDLEYQYDYGPGNLRLPGGKYAGPVSLIQFQYPGETLGIPSTADFLPGDLTQFGSPPGWFPTGYDAASTAVQNAYHPFVLEQSLIPQTKRYTAYADASYEITDSIEAYGEFLANRRETYQNGWRQIWAFGGTSDIFGTYWAPGWTGYNFLSPTGITNHADTSQRVDYYRTVGGIRGDLGGFMKGWSYDAYVQYSHNKGTYKTEQFLQDIYDISSFQTSSCAGTILPFSKKQCIDLPWTDPNFLAGRYTPEQADYMFDWETGKTIYKQLNAEASVSGNLFELPAGPVGMALGFTGRRDSIEDTPGDITYIVNEYYDPTVLVGSSPCRSTPYPCSPTVSNAWGNTASGITAGRTVTTEAFGEISVPIFKNQPFFKELSLSGAARITNVTATRRDDRFESKDNGNWTYKVGANWAVNNWLRFRGTYGTSYRAPALFELFKANESSFTSARRIDPCVNYTANLAQGNISQRVADNCAAEGIPGNYAGGAITATVISQGGVGVLEPETSRAKTASIILTPSFNFLPQTKLSLAVDYFDIKVKGEISQLGGATILYRCYDSEFYPTDPLCNLFTRGNGVDPLAVATVNDKYINIASQQSKGLDFTLLVQQNLGRLGSLTFLGNATYQLKDTFSLFVGTGQSNNGDIGDPKFVADLNLTWRNRSGLSVFWGTEIYGSASNEGKYRDGNGGDLCQTSAVYGEYCVDVKVPTTFYHNVSISKDLMKKTTLTVGIRNLFDTKPPRVSTIGGSGLPSLIGPVVGTSQYDFLGRRLFLNVSHKF